MTCEHDGHISSEWSDADQYGLRLMQGTCDLCGCAMVPNGDLDEEGRPGWEPAEPTWTAEELFVVAHQSGLV